MKKIEYIAPEMEVVKLAYSANMLAASFNENTDIPVTEEGGGGEQER